MAVGEQTTQVDSAKTPWGRRIFVGLVTLIIALALYVLSAGPMVVLMLRTGLYRNSVVEKGFQIVYWPLIRLSDSETAVGDWVEAYVEWWLAITHTNV